MCLKGFKDKQKGINKLDNLKQKQINFCSQCCIPWWPDTVREMWRICDSNSISNFQAYFGWVQLKYIFRNHARCEGHNTSLMILVSNSWFGNSFVPSSWTKYSRIWSAMITLVTQGLVVRLSESSDHMPPEQLWTSAIQKSSARCINVMEHCVLTCQSNPSLFNK